MSQKGIKVKTVTYNLARDLKYDLEVQSTSEGDERSRITWDDYLVMCNELVKKHMIEAE